MLDGLNLVVRDMPAMVEFYRLLGIDFEDALPPWDRHHRRGSPGGDVDFDLDSSEFASMWAEGWPTGQSGVVIGFRVASREAVDELHGALTEKGHGSQQEPYDAFWGARYAIVSDPDGNAVGIMSPIDPDRRSAPPTV